MLFPLSSARGSAVVIVYSRVRVGVGRCPFNHNTIFLELE